MEGGDGVNMLSRILLLILLSVGLYVLVLSLKE